MHLNARTLHAYCSDSSNRRKLLRFFVTGGLTALIYLSAAAAFVEGMELNPAIAGLMAFLIAIPTNYLLHKIWSFESERPHRKVIPKFFTVILMGMAINSALIQMLVTISDLNYFIAQILAMACVILWNFILFDWWVFRAIKQPR